MTLSLYQPNQENLIQITTKAKAFFQQKLKGKTTQAIRLSVKKSGCTGYAYVIDYGEVKVESDSELHIEGLTVYISEKAKTMIAGSEIDLVQQGLNQSIVFNNPNVTASCGCGSSFSVGEEQA